MSDFKLRLNTDISGNSEHDLVDALRELTRLIDNGFTSGFNSNDDGKFRFDIVETETLRDQINAGAVSALAEINPDDAAFLKRVDEVVPAADLVRDNEIVEKAIELFYKDGDLEIDPGAKCSHGGENGCYVQAWKWFNFSGTKWDKKKTVITAAQEFADRLNGRQIGEEITPEEESDAKRAGLLVIFGASDDCVEFRGVLNDEFYASSIVLHNPHVTVELGKDGLMWNFMTDAEHGKFTILEGNEIFCRGIVIKIK